MTIDVLPDNVLVEIFDFYLNEDDFSFPRWYTPRNMWHTLVHVSRRWRYLVFTSPRRLDLRLEYGGRRPMSEVLDAWPLLPVILISRDELLPSGFPHPKSGQRWENTVAALESEHHNRIREIYISDITDLRWERFVAAMQKPFPGLTYLHVVVRDVVPVLPDSFLGGCAPRLQTLWLRMFPFPSMPKLLLSANDLVTLDLWDIPDNGYIPPEALATALTVMTRLETLYLGFRSSPSLSDLASRPLLPPIRFVLPALTKLQFGGICEYLEDLLARIDAPLLYDLCIVFFMDVDFDVPQLHRLISHTEEFKTINHAELLIFDFFILLRLYPKTGAVDHRRLLVFQISYVGLGWQLLSLTRLCSSLALISTLEGLEIRYDYPTSSHLEDMENARWLGLLDLFTALKNLYLTHGIAQRVCRVLQELSGERATEVLPALRNLFIQGSSSLQPIREAMVPFVAARQLYGHPMVVEHRKD